MLAPIARRASPSDAAVDRPTDCLPGRLGISGQWHGILIGQTVVQFKGTGGAVMPKGEQRGNREAKKPKKEKQKTIAAAPSMKGSTGSNAGPKK
jgi:hypothetical protein